MGGVAGIEEQPVKKVGEESLNVRTIIKIVTLWLLTVPFALLVSFLITRALLKLL